jgi:perosamine synthetase
VSQLALLGGSKVIPNETQDIFTWPIVTREDEEAVLEVLRRGGMSDTDVTRKFEAEFAAWQGTTLALGFHNGTAALQAAMFGCKVGVGDEIICPSVTYWASCLPVYSLGGTVVFAEVDPETLCIDPKGIERCVSDRTKAIVVVHYCGHPADMDPIMKIARKHGLKVIEDVSHAQGGLYKGRMVGSIGDVGAMSLMSGKSFPTGEMGVFVTNNREIYDRAIAFGHYDRFNEKDIETEALKPWAGLPLGGYKFRVHQLSAAMARVQLKHQKPRIAEIQKAMNYFWDGLEGVPGIRAHRPPKGSGSTMAGWYAAKGLYRPEEVGGLSVTRFCEALRAEGCSGVFPGANKPLHLHPLFNEVDVYGHGKPTRIANSIRDLRQPPGSLPVSEVLMSRLYSIPWFKHHQPKVIDLYVEAFRKVSAGHKELLAGDKGDPVELGSWHSYRIR